MTSRMVALPLVALCLVGCGVQHIEPYVPRSRDFDTSGYDADATPVSAGSLWVDSSRSLVADFRAARVGDVVTIRIDESPEAQGDASTTLERDSQAKVGFSKLLGIAQAIERAAPEVDTSTLLEYANEVDFEGTGETSRGSRVQGLLSVRVRKVLANGDLFVEGHKVLMINNEELHIYASGVVRPQDIAQDNTVDSSMIADAQVEFTGRGDLTVNQRQGWFQRMFNRVNPL